MTAGLSETPNKAEWSAFGMRTAGANLQRDFGGLFDGMYISVRNGQKSA